MKRLLMIVLLSLAANAGLNGQTVILKGKVSDCHTKAGIGGVKVEITGSDSSKRMKFTRSDGSYSFNPGLKPDVDYILSFWAENGIGASPPVKYGLCPYSFIEKVGYSGRENFKLRFSKKDSIVVQDACYPEILACPNAPNFTFKKNSTDLSRVSGYGYEFVSTDTSLDCYTAFLIARKSWVIELAGHAASNEENKEQLAAARAKKLADLFISKGIEPERIVSAGFSDSRLGGKNTEEGKWIENDTDDPDNSRVTISLLRKDYTPKPKNFNLSGKITDCRTKRPLQHAEIKLVCSDGRSLSTFSDSLGHYSFDTSALLRDRQYVATVSANSETFAPSDPRTKVRGFIGSGDKYRFSTHYFENAVITQDFCLVRGGCVMKFPEFRFAKNSSSDHWLSDSLNNLEFAFQILQDNPNFVVELIGRASKDEKQPKALAQKRADLIRKLLIEKGIEPERLVSTSLSNTKPYEYLDDYTYEVTLYDKDDEASYSMNRNVVLNIIRKDYRSAKPVKEHTPSPVEEEGE